jgi:hypothetical protein
MTGGTERHLERKIAVLTAHLAFCLEQARVIDPKEDGYGHARSAQVGNAIALANKISAKLGLAMRKARAALRQ